MGRGRSRRSRFVPSGVAVYSFRVATKRFARRNEAGERTVETDWTPVEAWDKLAEACALPANGRSVRITGSLYTHSWEDCERGQKRFKTIVRTDEVLFLDARPGTPDEAAAIEETAEALPFASISAA